MRNIYVSFIEEAIMNPDYNGYIGGRVEVTKPDDTFHSGEIRFFTKRVREFNRFRDAWDMKEVSPNELSMIETEIARRFRLR